MSLKPMLAATASVADIEALLKRSPVYALPKLDGIRCLIKDGKLLTRSLKAIPNRFINAKLGNLPGLEGLDGELIVGEPVGNDVMNRTTRGVMREAGEPDFTFWAFDHHTESAPYELRLRLVDNLVAEENLPYVKLVEAVKINSMAQLEKYEAEALALGFEGLILRHPNGLYKFGRSTLNEAGMLKLKRFEDREAVVIGYEAEMENTNAAMRNELGRTKRSSAKAGMVAKDTLGNLLLHDIEKGWKFSVGSGFDDAEAARLWAMGDKLLGQTVKYKFFPIGVLDGPRFPVYLGTRDARDIS